MKGTTYYLPEGSYTQFKIPKRSKGMRIVNAPSKELKKYQRKLLPELTDVYYNIVKDTPVEHTAYGFLEGRNVIMAAKLHQPFKYTTSFDLKDFFDSVTPKHIKNVPTKGPLAHIILKQVATDRNLWHNMEYAGQGFSTSPMLANIAAIPFMLDLQDTLYHHMNTQFIFTMYADDITISYNDFYELNTVKNSVHTVANKHSFQIKPSKTRTRHAKHGARRILGINVYPDKLEMSRKCTRKLRAAKHQRNGPSIGGLTRWSQLPLPTNPK